MKGLLKGFLWPFRLSESVKYSWSYGLNKVYDRPITVRNIDRTHNSARAIIHQVEVNVYYKGHVERIRIDVCDLGKTDVILGIPWLQAHNLKINWETGEVKIMRCPPLCGRNMKLKKESKVKREKRVVTLEEEKIMRWAVDNKKD